MNKILQGDCLDTLKTLPDNSIDAIVTDPPYGLSFMGKKWDYDVPKTEIWKECLRVLKPGGYLLSFAGTRTQHRMAVNIEDAGFEIRDMIAWVYSTGFPKSLNVFKQLEKRCECGNMGEYERTKKIPEPFVRPLQESDLSQTIADKKTKGQVLQSGLQEQNVSHNGRLSEEISLSEGRKKSGVERRANIQATEGELQGSDLSKMSAGVPGNGKKRRIHNATPTSDGDSFAKDSFAGRGSTSQRPQSEQQQDREPCAFCKQWGTQAARSYGIGSALKPACEPITVARKPLSEPTLGDNFLKWGVGGINIDGCRVESSQDDKEVMDKKASKNPTTNYSNKEDKIYSAFSEDRASPSNPIGRFPANLIHDGSDEVVGLFPVVKAGVAVRRNVGHSRSGNINYATGSHDGDMREDVGYGDSGSASRFFKQCNFSNEDICQDQNRINRVQSAEVPLTVQEKRIAQEAVGISGNLGGVQNQKESPASPDFIGNSGNFIQSHKNVGVEKSESTDTTLTTQNSTKSSGFAPLVTGENTKLVNQENDNELVRGTRFLYQAKASKSERNKGCEGLEEKAGIRTNAPRENEDIKTPTRTNNHPTVKPIALMEYLIKLVSKEGHTILDPFAGSGSTLIAAKKLKRNYIGCELDPEYIKIAEARIGAVKQESKLF